jgi:hypothetical protein
MKKFKQFKSEQQHITETGPILTALMGVLGLGMAGLAGYKSAVAAKDKWKGYKENQADKKERKKEGFTMSIKTFNPETGKDEAQDYLIDPVTGNDDLAKLGYELPRTLTGKIKAPDNDELDKMEKEADRKSKRKSAEMRAAIANPETSPEELAAVLTTDQLTKVSDIDTKATKKKDTEDEKERADERKPAKYWVGKERDVIPAGKADKVRSLEAKAIKDGNGVLDWQDKWETEDTPTGWTKVKDPEGDEDDFEFKKTADVEAEREKNKQNTGGGSSNGAGQGTTTGKAAGGALTNLAKTQGLSSQRILKFGEFISEGVMNDLLKATKSKKDSEITLDDGADIPIDPLTSQILVKYIEGLSSSEKNRTIQQIQRTERAFMKVLGKAHEG